MFYSTAYVGLISSVKAVVFSSQQGLAIKGIAVPSAVGEPGEGTCAGTAGTRSPGRGHRAGLAHPAGSLPSFFSLLGGKGSTECFTITQRILEHVSCGALAGGDEGWHVFKAAEGKSTVRCSFLLPSQGDGAV